MKEMEFEIPGIELFEKKQILIDDRKINYATTGNEKTTIILIHGWTNDWTGMIPVGKNLIDKYRVILIDLPGFGESDALDKYSMEILAIKLKKFTEALELEDYCIVAHSMGTCVESMFYKMFPISAKKLIFIGAIVESKRKRKLSRVISIFFRIIVKKNTGRKIVKKLIERRIYAYFTAKYFNMYKFNKDLIDKYGLVGKIRLTKDAYADMGKEIMKSENWKLLKDNKIPMLFIYGKYDKVTKEKVAKKYLENQGNYNFLTIEDSGHIVTIEKPEEVAKAIKDFVN